MATHAPITSTTQTRRAALLSGVALLLAAPAVGAAAASDDRDLIALLNKARADLHAWQYAPADTAPTLASILAPKPWEATMHAAAMLPARTPQGIRAKAETVADWLAGSDRRTGPGFDCTRESAVAWSLLRDLLGADEIAPVPPLRRRWTEEDEARATITMPAPASPDADLIRLCAAYIEAVEAYNDGGGHLEPEDDPLWAAIEEVEAEVDGLEATTLAGIAAKARVAVFLAETPHGEDFSTSHTGEWPEQVVRDVLRLAATTAPT